MFIAERSGFEPEIRFCRIHAFQACLLSHSSISPEWECKYTESFCFFATLKNCFDFFAGFSLGNRRIFHWEIAGFFTGTSPVFSRDFRETDENVIEMAVGVIIGGAFGKIVTSLVSDVVMPPIGLLIGGLNFSDLKWTMKQAVTDASGAVISPAVTLNWGNFIQVSGFPDNRNRYFRGNQIHQPAHEKESRRETGTGSCT